MIVSEDSFSSFLPRRPPQCSGAEATIPVASAISPPRLTIIGMAAGAGGFVAHGIVTAAEILTPRDGLQVRRIHAGVIATEVVCIIVGRNPVLTIGEALGGDERPPNVKQAVTFPIAAANPNPAATHRLRLV
jgi:hypothetical protein